MARATGTLAGRGAGLPANRRRGEVAAVIDGAPRILCLTLGALAELEAAFDVEDLAALAARFSSGRLSAADMVRVIGAGLRGGGNLFTDEEVAAMAIDGGIAGSARIVAELLGAAFGGHDGPSGNAGVVGGRGASPDPLRPQGA